MFSEKYSVANSEPTVLKQKHFEKQIEHSFNTASNRTEPTLSKSLICNYHSSSEYSIDSEEKENRNSYEIS